MRSERGETLIELLLSIVLMGIVVVAVLASLITLTSIADRNTKVTRSSVLVQSYAEQLKQPATSTLPSTYKTCATPAGANAYPAFSGSTPTGYTVTVTKVEFWDSYGYTSSTPKEPSFVDSASCTTARDSGLQRITIEANSNTTPAAKETLVIIKRNTTCPSLATYGNPDLGPC